MTIEAPAMGPATVEVRPDVVEHAPAPTRVSRRVKVLLAVDLVVAIGYVSWWLVPGRMGTPVLFWLLVAAECFTVLHVLGLWSAIWSTKVDDVPAVSRTRSIDVFIPTYGEPVPVLERTVAAALAMDGAHVTYVLDDADRPEVQALAVRLGALYIARTENSGAKAGNINNALRQTSGELVAVFDADHVPAPNFLTTLLGHFEADDVAFVQSPQYYGNGATEAVSRGAYQQQAIFYGPIMRGKNGQDSAFCCGTNVVFRRTALDDVGGLVEDNVCEDFVTSMHLHRKGWRSIYYPYPLAEGLGPSTLGSYFKQQFRWARGSVGALFTGEPFRRGFSVRQRLQYLLATSFYLTGLVTCVYLLLPPMYLFFGLSAFSASSGTFAFFYAPYLLLGLLTIRVALGGQLRLEHLQYTFGTFPVYAMASIAAVLRLPASFGVTSKSTTGRVRPPSAANVTIAVAAVTLVAMVYGAIVQPFNARTVTNLSWSLINVLLLSGVALVALRERRTGSVVPASDSLLGLRTPVVVPLQGQATAEQDTVTPERMLPVALGRSAVDIRRPVWQIVSALTVLAAVVRLALINVSSLWLDETLTLRQARLSLPDLWRFELEENVHVPLFHTVVHFWIKLFGTSEIALRMPSVIFGVVAVPLLFVVGRRICGERTAIVAAALGATSPFWVWHSTEARMYPMLLAFCLASMWALFSALDNGGARRWAVYAVITGLSFYVHYYALLMPVVHGMWLLTQRAPRRQVKAWLLGLTGAGLFFVPWVVALFKYRFTSTDAAASFSSGIGSQAQHQGLFGVVFGMIIFVAVLLVGYHTSFILALLSATLFGLWPLAALRGALSGSLTGWLRSRTAAFLLGWAGFLIIGVYLLDIAKPGAWMQRYLIVASVPVILMLAEVLSKLFRRQLLVVAAVVVVSLAVTAAQYLEPRNPVRQDFRGAVKSIEAQARPGDVILVEPFFNKAAVDYYLDADAVRLEGAGSKTYPASAFLKDEFPGLLRNIPAGGHVWVVTQYEDSTDPRHVLRRSMDQALGTTSLERFGAELRVSMHPVQAGATVPAVP